MALVRVVSRVLRARRPCRRGARRLQAPLGPPLPLGAAVGRVSPPLGWRACGLAAAALCIRVVVGVGGAFPPPGLWGRGASWGSGPPVRASGVAVVKAEGAALMCRPPPCRRLPAASRLATSAWTSSSSPSGWTTDTSPRILGCAAWTCSAARGIIIGADVMTGEWLEWASSEVTKPVLRLRMCLRMVHSTCQLT